MSKPLQFTVHGIPAPQGSKAPWGGESNPRTRPWRAAVTAEAAIAMKKRPFLDKPVMLSAVFFFPRPKHHFGSGKKESVLKESAPTYHATKPDADKLLRAIGDSLSGVVFRDDSHIACVAGVKRYGEPARVEITVTELTR